MKVDPVTGACPVSVGGETVALRFTNSAYAYVEDEAKVDAAQDAIRAFLEAAMPSTDASGALVDGKVRFSLVLAFGRAFLRAAGKDPALVDRIARDDLVAAVAALIVSTIDQSAPAAENPPAAAG